MYRCKESGLKIYESLDELLDADIIDMFEYDGDYYISVQPEHFHDEAVWKVNKQSGKVSVIHYVETFCIADKDKIQINPNTLKRAS